MADKNQGILAELGLDTSLNSVAQRAVQNSIQAPNSSNAGAFMALGQQLGAGMGPGVAGLVGGLAGLWPGKGGFKQGAQNMVDRANAQVLGMTPEAYKARNATQKAIQSVKTPNTGDPIADQMSTLRQVISAANANGDSEMALKATQKLQVLRTQALAFKQAGLETEGMEREERIAAEDESMGREVYLVGDDRDGPSSTGRLEEDGTWTIFRPDGSIQKGIDGDSVFGADRTALRARKFETPEGRLEWALDRNGFTKTNTPKVRAELTSLGETADIVTRMGEGILNMYDPKIAFSDSSDLARIADRGFSLVESVSNLFSSPEAKTKDSWRVTYDGKPVSAAKQRELALNTSHFDKYLASQGVNFRDVLPPHIAPDSEEAAIFKGNMMRLAYLDARLQEPSNRGLSDADIQNALERIGAASPNPRVFARQWQARINELQGRMSRLGQEVVGFGDVSRSEILDFVYSPELRDTVNNKLQGASDTMDTFLAAYGGDPNAAPAAPAPAGLEGLSDEELLQRLEALEAAEAEANPPPSLNLDQVQ